MRAGKLGALAAALGEVEAALKRAIVAVPEPEWQPMPAGRTVEVGPLRLEPRRRQAWWQGTALSLSRDEYALLLRPARTPDEVVTKAESFAEVWSYPEGPSAPAPWTPTPRAFGSARRRRARRLGGQRLGPRAARALPRRG